MPSVKMAPVHQANEQAGLFGLLHARPVPTGSVFPFYVSLSCRWRGRPARVLSGRPPARLEVIQPFPVHFLLSCCDVSGVLFDPSSIRRLPALSTDHASDRNTLRTAAFDAARPAYDRDRLRGSGTSQTSAAPPAGCSFPFLIQP